LAASTSRVRSSFQVSEPGTLTGMCAAALVLAVLAGTLIPRRAARRPEVALSYA
jgi:hypothetical protein